jgi:hypothetical protein
MSKGLKRKFMDMPLDIVKWPSLDAQWSDADLASAALINALCLECSYVVRPKVRVLQSRSLIAALDLHVYDVSQKLFISELSESAYVPSWPHLVLPE